MAAARPWQRVHGKGLYMSDSWQTELERVFDVVTLEKSPDGAVFRAFYWEEDAELELRVSSEQRSAELILKRGEHLEQLRISPVERVTARISREPHRLDLDKQEGGRLTIW